MARLWTNPLMILLLVFLSTVSGCGVMPAGNNIMTRIRCCTLSYVKTISIVGSVIATITAAFLARPYLEHWDV
ncbi:hypothetical protein KIN20_010700 [Parelaphostrongylus tenuis]|uniref:Uncharacterized protein n=1 Tax=Parelaphostrongylus tenuis TaxID=148309 RepID=A0AAD5MUD0_PARTN|nr:hypothetical protein KIN20_010693 [Parelaphostrongylus tenuis]KAJ1353922.1 hypothetical protein KIN20_010700 [Parelaphostrongylus tenuis]